MRAIRRFIKRSIQLLTRRGRADRRLPEFVGMLEHLDPTLSQRVEELLAEDFRRDEDRSN